MSNKTIAGAPEEIRTPDPQIRSLVLYPAELRARRATLSMTEFRKSIRGPDRGAGPGPGPGGPARRAADAGDPDAGRNQIRHHADPSVCPGAPRPPGPHVYESSSSQPTKSIRALTPVFAGLCRKRPDASAGAGIFPENAPT
jgi:hypothetical protein